MRTNLLYQQPLGDINRAYQTLIQEEYSRVASRDKGVSDTVYAFYAQSDHGKARFTRVDKSKLVCTHCKQKGEEMRELGWTVWDPNVGWAGYRGTGQESL